MSTDDGHVLSFFKYSSSSTLSSAGVFRPSQEFVERGLPQWGVLHLAVARRRAARRWDVLVDGRVDVRGGVAARAGASSGGARIGV